MEREAIGEDDISKIVESQMGQQDAEPQEKKTNASNATTTKEAASGAVSGASQVGAFHAILDDPETEQWLSAGGTKTRTKTGILDDAETQQWLSVGVTKMVTKGSGKEAASGAAQAGALPGLLDDSKTQQFLERGFNTNMGTEGLSRTGSHPVDYVLEDKTHPMQKQQQQDGPGGETTSTGTGTVPQPNSLARSQRAQQSAMPGAFAHGTSRDVGVDDVDTESDVDSESDNTDDVDEVEAGNNDEGLVVANLLSDEEEAQNLPQAEFAHPSETNGTQKTKAVMAILSCGLCLIILAVVVVVTLAFKEEGNTKNTTMLSQTANPTPTPTMAPTSLENYVFSLLPHATQAVIQDNPTSPQAKAYQWILNDTEYNSLTPQRMVQRFSLATLFLSTNGDKWNKNTNWLNHTVHECDWYTKNQFGMKSFFGTLFRGYLSEFFPPSSGPQPAICNETSGLFHHLWLDRNGMYGPLPPELFLLTTLQTLSLRLNSAGDNIALLGPISSHIGLLTDLEGVIIDNMREGGPMPTQLGTMTKLRALSLSGNRHTGTIPTQVGLLTNMQTLSMTGVQLSGPMPDISSFPKLKMLFLNGGNQLTGTIPTQIGQIKTLEVFSVGSNKLNGTLPTQVGLLSNLQMLSIHDNELEGSIPTQLGLMTSSTHLPLSKNRFSNAIPSEFGMLAANLSKALHLHENMLSGTLPTQLGLLTNVGSMAFNNNSHTGQIPSELGLLLSIGAIWLGNNSLTGTIPQSLGSLQQSLYVFDVESNPLLSGIIPSPLCDLNGTCAATFELGPCTESNLLGYDCTELLCGCNCSCSI